MKSKTSFKESRLYPVIFMIILSAGLTLVLAFFFQATRERVETYKQVSFQRELLAVFSDIEPEFSSEKLKALVADKLNELYNNNITRHSFADSLIYYEYIKEDRSQGYAFLISAQGLWSTIKVLVAIEPGFESYQGLSIIEQAETPGLGARIEEDWFQKQFTGKSFMDDNGFVKLILSEEKAQDSKYEIHKVTGATTSSRAVLSAVQDGLQKIYQEHFDLSSESSHE